MIWTLLTLVISVTNASTPKMVCRVSIENHFFSGAIDRSAFDIPATSAKECARTARSFKNNFSPKTIREKRVLVNWLKSPPEKAKAAK